MNIGFESISNTATPILYIAEKAHKGYDHVNFDGKKECKQCDVM